MTKEMKGLRGTRDDGTEEMKRRRERSGEGDGGVLVTVVAVVVVEGEFIGKESAPLITKNSL